MYGSEKNSSNNKIDFFSEMLSSLEIDELLPTRGFISVLYLILTKWTP